ncbi:MAG: QueT transporter family protein [Clostridium sp.]|nr:QueT transporter family protein [Clostridium sp.]MBO6150580.1 QueT transporter family protein [Clostridium sp.]
MNEQKPEEAFRLAYGGVLAGIYVVLTMVFAPVSFGPVQFRISEALCIMPYFSASAVPGLFAGCLLSNLLCGAMPMDVIFGSIATLLGAVGSRMLRRRKWLVCVPPIVSNTLIIPWVLRYAYGAEELIPFMMVTVGIGEVLAIGVLGNILLVTLEKIREKGLYVSDRF